MNDEKSLYLQIGERVRQAREAAGITQGQLGERVVLTRASITNIEKARQHVQLHTLYAIARELQVPVASLLPEQSGLGAQDALGRITRAFAKAPSASAEERRFIASVLSPSVVSLQHGEERNADQQNPGANLKTRKN